MKKKIYTWIKPKNKEASSLDEIFSPVSQDLRQVEKLLQVWYCATSPVIKKMASQVISSQGKLIRPGLLLLATGHLGYRGNEGVRTAAAVEAVHTASLIHDDIIDDSPTRRGQKTAARIFGTGFSLLLGDYLFIKSIGNSLAITRKNIPQILARVTEQMIEGEIDELAHSYNFNLTERQYFQIIRKKTAGLFQASCEIACTLDDAPKEEESALRLYGLNLGLTFQVVDDLLDLAGNPVETGKDRFSDLKEGRVTLPLILALKNSPPEIEPRLKTLLEKIKSQPEENNLITLLRLIEKSGALNLTFKKAKRLAEGARRAANKLIPSIYRQSLLDLLDFVLYRKK
jgi:octaprenyl-diphosphate synthase